MVNIFFMDAAAPQHTCMASLVLQTSIWVDHLFDKPLGHQLRTTTFSSTFCGSLIFT